MSAVDSKITYEEFGDAVEAHLYYVLGLSAEEALTALRQRVDDGTWVRAPNRFGQSLQLVARRSSGELHEAVKSVYEAVIAALIGRPLDGATHELLQVLCYDDSLSLDDSARVATWLAAVAGPGDASLVAYVVERSLGHTYGGSREGPVAPLVTWLLANGAAELRARRHATLVRRLVEFALERPDDRDLLLAVRYALISEAPPPAELREQGERHNGANAIARSPSRRTHNNSARSTATSSSRCCARTSRS